MTMAKWVLCFTLFSVTILSSSASDVCWTSAVCDNKPTWIKISSSSSSCTAGNTDFEKKVQTLSDKIAALESQAQDLKNRMDGIKVTTPTTTHSEEVTTTAEVTTKGFACKFSDGTYCYKRLGVGTKKTQISYQNECAKRPGGKLADFEKVKDLSDLGKFLTDYKREDCTPCFMLMKSSETTVGSVLKWGYSVVFTTSDQYEGHYALCQFDLPTTNIGNPAL